MSPSVDGYDVAWFKENSSPIKLLTTRVMTLEKRNHCLVFLKYFTPFEHLKQSSVERL